MGQKYDICSFEDPFAEDDWDSWTPFNKETKVQVVGDDLTVTNPKFIKKAIEQKSCNALLLKVSCISFLSIEMGDSELFSQAHEQINQIGTITEAIQACVTCSRLTCNADCPACSSPSPTAGES